MEMEITIGEDGSVLITASTPATSAEEQFQKKVVEGIAVVALEHGVDAMMVIVDKPTS